MQEKGFAGHFSENLRRRRVEMGLTQKRLGELLGYSEKSVSKWESGEVIAPSNVLPALSEILRVSIDTLLCSGGEPRYFLGVDGGGTKCEFLLADSDGKTISRTVLGACNPVDIGLDAALEVLRRGIDTVLGKISPSTVSVFVGVAGGISGENKQHIAAFLEKYNFAKMANGSDAENAVAASLGTADGITVIAGTGSIAFVKKSGATSRVGGHGYLIDEGGNGFSLGQAAIRAALLDEEGSLEQHTLLTPLVKAKCERTTILEAISDFYRGGKREIASYATLVFEAAEQGDEVANNIIKTNAACIAKLIESAGRKISDQKVRTVIVGGLTAKSDVLLPLITEALVEKERYDLSVFTGAPVKGAILLAGGKLNA